MMTNEELAVAIRNGRTDLYGLLWSQVDKFVSVKVKDFLGDRKSYRGCDAEDLQQAGFVALVAAVRGFDCAAGAKFLTYLSFHLTAQFHAAVNMRTERAAMDPINSPVSLDQKAFKDQDVTLADLQPDPRDHFQPVEDAVQNEQLHEALDKALGELPEPEADLIRKRYYDQISITALADLEGRSYGQINATIARALKRLQRTAKKNGLDQFLDDRTNFYRSLNYRTTQTSPVEWLTILRTEFEERYKRMNERDPEKS